MTNQETQKKIDKVLELMEETSLRTLKVQASALLPMFFEIAEELFCIIDSSQRFVLVSKSWTDALGFSKSELEGSVFYDFVHEDDRAKADADSKRYNMGGELLSQYYFNRYLKKEGGFVWVRWLPQVSDLYQTTGFIVGVASVVIDPAVISMLNGHYITNPD